MNVCSLHVNILKSILLKNITTPSYPVVTIKLSDTIIELKQSSYNLTFLMTVPSVLKLTNSPLLLPSKIVYPKIQKLVQN